MSTPVNNWMSWEAGVDLVAATKADLASPNVIVHVARLVHTPVGSAASGIVFYQPDPTAAPEVFGFVSHDPSVVGRYFGPKIFAGTPFEGAPVLGAKIDIEIGSDFVGATVVVAGRTIKTRLTQLSAAELVNRPPGAFTPFVQQGVEAAAGKAQLWVDGKEVTIFVPPIGISGGPAAVSAPTGLYAR